jgi:hypothetical protein
VVGALLNDRCPIPAFAPEKTSSKGSFDQVASAKIAVDRQIEKG